MIRRAPGARWVDSKNENLPTSCDGIKFYFNLGDLRSSGDSSGADLIVPH